MQLKQEICGHIILWCGDYSSKWTSKSIFSSIHKRFTIPCPRFKTTSLSSKLEEKHILLKDTR